ncbi:MAG: hypothetical protein IPP82_01875 [Xanthomonadales bacterium]|nr:hypothetical protein [Xanthomonadales bacterium]
MNTITTAAGLVGIDLAKIVFSICEVDGRGRVRDGWICGVRRLRSGCTDGRMMCPDAFHTLIRVNFTG